MTPHIGKLFPDNELLPEARLDSKRTHDHGPQPGYAFRFQRVPAGSGKRSVWPARAERCILRGKQEPAPTAKNLHSQETDKWRGIDKLYRELASRGLPPGKLRRKPDAELEDQIDDIMKSLNASSSLRESSDTMYATLKLLYFGRPDGGAPFDRHMDELAEQVPRWHMVL